MISALLASLTFGALVGPTPHAMTRRAILVNIPLFTTAAAAATAEDDADPLKRLSKAEQTLALLDDGWLELTTDCKYGEINRDLLKDASKEALLQAASQTSKEATMVTLCRRTGNNVRDFLGSTGKPTPLARIGALLERPSLLQRVDFDRLEEFQNASERLQQALSAADGSAFLSSNDFSTQNTFAKGAETNAPNLDASREALRIARKEIATVLKCIQ